MRRLTKQSVDTAGFSFVEVLAAMLFMAIVLPVVVEGSQIAHRAAVVSARSNQAAQLADRKLTELVVTSDYLEGEQEGDFEPDYPGYHWTLSTEGWSEDVMRLLTLEVSFEVQGRPFAVQLSTIVRETGL